LLICQHMSELPLRIFVVISNKRNMRGYRNKRAERMGSKQWFYNWMSRLLIERVSDYCHRRADQEGLNRRHVKFVFSKADGHSYSQTKAYYEYLRHQTSGNMTVLRKRVPSIDVLSFQLVEEFPHYKRAGLQYADIVAGAFYQAVDNLDTGPCNPSYAIALSDRIAWDKDRNRKDYGVALQPSQYWRIPMGEDQREIFRHYGYSFRRW